MFFDHKKILFFMLITSSCVSLKPLSETTMHSDSIAGGAVIGVALGSLTYFALISESQKISEQLINGIRTRQETVELLAAPKAAALLSTIVGVGAGLLSWRLLDNYLHKLPLDHENIYACLLTIKQVEADSLIQCTFGNEADFFIYATERFGTSWPLVLAHQKYLALNEELLTARNKLNFAYDKTRIKNDERDATDARAACDKISGRITNLAQTIDSKISALVKSYEYAFQKELFDYQKEARKKAHER